MNYKYLALDLDGTLTNSQKEISPRTKIALKKAYEKGIQIILASGRPEVGVYPVAEQLSELGIKPYILAYNGGRIIDYAEKKDLYRAEIPMKFYKDICQAYHEFPGVNLLCYDENGIICENINDKYVELEAYTNKITAKEVSSLYEAIKSPVCKFLSVGENENLLPYANFLKEQFPDALNVFFSEPFFIEIVAPNVDKADSLRKLLEILGGKQEELIACGDGMNDFTMLDFAGLSVAMANANEKLKEHADFITESNDEDGVAIVIEKFLL